MGMKSRLTNKRARYDYTIAETLEAGMALTGQEVKSLRLGRGSLSESRVVFRGGEAYLINMNIPGYSNADIREYEPTRSRKLLLHKNQIESWEQKTNASGYSVIPLAVYPKKGVFKVELGLARGKKQFEKRETIKRRDIEREVERDMKQRVR